MRKKGREKKTKNRGKVGTELKRLMGRGKER